MRYISTVQRRMLVRRLDHLTGDLVRHLERLRALGDDLGVDGDDLGLSVVEVRGAVARVRAGLVAGNE